MVKRRLGTLIFLTLNLAWSESIPVQAVELVIKLTHPGYVTGNFNDVLYRTAIMSDGTVVKGYRIDPYSQWQEHIVAHLSDPALADLNGKLAQLESGDLNFPSGPGYADSPTSSYAGYTNNGELVTFYEYSFGQWGKLESYPFAEELKMLMDSY